MQPEAKYYYENAISALWMKEFHNFKYESLDGLYIENKTEDAAAWEYVAKHIRQERGTFAEPKFYLRSSSAKELEPCEGDLGQDRLGMICWFLNKEWHWDSDLKEDSGFEISYPIQILIRFGQPFIYPKMEEIGEEIVKPPNVLISYRYVTQDCVIPSEVKDVRPLKNISSDAIEVKNPEGQTIKLLFPQEVFNFADLTRKAA